MASDGSQTQAFPAIVPLTKPGDRPLSAAMHRLYDLWTPSGDGKNPFHSNFRYTRISGIGKEEGVSRRDPSTVVKVGETYYVWYTKRQTASGPVGFEAQTETLPAVNWDLSDIWYAASRNGSDWAEQGIAVHRAPRASMPTGHSPRPLCARPVSHGLSRPYAAQQRATDRETIGG